VENLPQPVADTGKARDHVGKKGSTVMQNLRDELICRARALSETAGSLAEVITSLGPDALPVTTLATACGELDRLNGQLRTLSDRLGALVDPQRRG